MCKQEAAVEEDRLESPAWVHINLEDKQNEVEP